MPTPSKELYIFQRRPSSIDVRNNQDTDAVWFQGLQSVCDFDLVNDNWTSVGCLPMKDPSDPVAESTRIDFAKMEEVMQRVSAVVKDDETAESLKAYYVQLPLQAALVPR
ncbi:hypothetical protein PMIN06_011449 [Paraphaeosphaeria minitans]|uniref:Pentalenolactone D synthase n=1 Tax=Paraphaeosphaeria minitans TaxID=565426 RepID=A0A9P6GBX5_9PLEO|nr:Pentalenolactone D synthase [Paraphaeosphaeria minitans]